MFLKFSNPWIKPLFHGQKMWVESKIDQKMFRVTFSNNKNLALFGPNSLYQRLLVFGFSHIGLFRIFSDLCNLCIHKKSLMKPREISELQKIGPPILRSKCFVTGVKKVQGSLNYIHDSVINENRKKSWTSVKFIKK